MALAMPISTPKGSVKPRIAPPTPAVSNLADFRRVAGEIGIDLMPWQENAARYLEARDADGRHLYREVGVVVARQNGKTTLLVPLIVKDLLDGRRVMHTAQDRRLPQEVFFAVAEIMWSQYPELFPERNGRATKPRYANGQEEVRLNNGGVYSIVAPTRGGARGPSRDRVILDELLEMDSWDFIAAAKPTMTAALDPQMVYLSNMGDESSIVLNALRARAGTDPGLAYLEWSAREDRTPADRIGWAEANPAMGYEAPGMGSVLATLEADYRTALIEGTLAIFETEHLCRKVKTMRQALVDMEAWKRSEGVLGEPTRVFMGISLDPEGTRASAVLAWQQPDNTMDLRLLIEATGNPINVDKLGRDLRDAARENHVTTVGFHPLTDSVLAKYFGRTESIAGQKHANASARFVTLTEAGKLRWADCAAVGNDLTWTARKDHDESGSFQAVRANDDRPITAALASIWAVWLASEPPFERKPRVGVGYG